MPKSGRVSRLESRMPNGFIKLLEGLSKSILTARPLNVYKFAADYLEAELDRRVLAELSQTGIITPAPCDKDRLCAETPIRQLTASVTELAKEEIHQEQVKAPDTSTPDTCTPQLPKDGRPVDTPTCDFTTTVTEHAVGEVHQEKDAQQDISPLPLDDTVAEPSDVEICEDKLSGPSAQEPFDEPTEPEVASSHIADKQEQEAEPSDLGAQEPSEEPTQLEAPSSEIADEQKQEVEPSDSGAQEPTESEIPSEISDEKAQEAEPRDSSVQEPSGETTQQEVPSSQISQEAPEAQPESSEAGGAKAPPADGELEESYEDEDYVSRTSSATPRLVTARSQDQVPMTAVYDPATQSIQLIPLDYKSPEEEVDTVTTFFSHEVIQPISEVEKPAAEGQQQMAEEEQRPAPEIPSVPMTAIYCSETQSIELVPLEEYAAILLTAPVSGLEEEIIAQTAEPLTEATPISLTTVYNTDTKFVELIPLHSLAEWEAKHGSSSTQPTTTSAQEPVRPAPKIPSEPMTAVYDSVTKSVELAPLSSIEVSATTESKGEPSLDKEEGLGTTTADKPDSGVEAEDGISKDSPPNDCKAPDVQLTTVYNPETRSVELVPLADVAVFTPAASAPEQSTAAAPCEESSTSLPTVSTLGMSTTPSIEITEPIEEPKSDDETTDDQLASAEDQVPTVEADLAEEPAPVEGEAPDAAESEASPAESEAPPAESEAQPAENDAQTAESEAPAENEAPPAGSEAQPAANEAQPAESESPAEDEAPPAEDEAPPAENEAPPAEDEAPPAENEAPPAENESSPAENEAPPAENEASPAEDEAPPAENEAPPAEDEAPPAENEAQSAENEDMITTFFSHEVIEPIGEDEVPPAENEAQSAENEDMITTFFSHEVIEPIGENEAQPAEGDAPPAEENANQEA